MVDTVGTSPLDTKNIYILAIRIAPVTLFYRECNYIDMFDID